MNRDSPPEASSRRSSCCCSWWESSGHCAILRAEPMSYSPLITPPRPSRRRARSLARRRRRRAALFGALTLAVVALAVALAVSGGGRQPRDTTAQIAHGRRLPRAPARHLSAVGFPLAKPAFALSGLSAPGQDPLRLAFHKPPRAGLL